MNKHNSNKLKENSNTVRHLIIGQIITTQNLVAIKEVRHAGQSTVVVVWFDSSFYYEISIHAGQYHQKHHLVHGRKLRAGNESERSGGKYCIYLIYRELFTKYDRCGLK